MYSQALYPGKDGPQRPADLFTQYLALSRTQQRGKTNRGWVKHPWQHIAPLPNLTLRHPNLHTPLLSPWLRIPASTLLDSDGAGSPDDRILLSGMNPRTSPPPPNRNDTSNPVAEVCREGLEMAAEFGLDVLQAAGEAACTAKTKVADAAESAASAAGEAAGTVASVTVQTAGLAVEAVGTAAAATGEVAGAVVETIGSIAP